MTSRPRIMSSNYMHWAKTRVHARFNLGISGILNYPLRELPVTLGDLEITGDSYYGYAPLVEALSQKCGVPAGKIFTTVGTSMANHLAMAAAVEAGDEILIEQPTYELLVSTAQYLGAVVKRFPRREEDFQIDPDEVRRHLGPKTKLIVLTNLHNPSSVLTEEDTLRELGKLAGSVGASVLVDEVYLDAAFDRGVRSAVHLGDQFISTNSLTKVYGLSGLRCGWVLGNPAFIEKLWRLNDLFNVIPSHTSEILSVIALNNLPKILARTRSILEPNQRIIGKILSTRDDLAAVTPGFGNVVFPKLLKRDAEKFCETLLRDYETLVVPGKFFEMTRNIRIGLGVTEFPEGISRLVKALDS